MARQREKIYRRRRPLRTFLKVLLALLLTLAVLAVVVFFWFQRYIRYTSEGVRLDVPFLRGILDELPEEEDEPLPSDLIIVSPTPAPEPEEDEAAAYLYSLLIGPQDLEGDADWGAALPGLGADALAVLLKDEMGQLAWDTGVPLAATSYDLAGDVSLTRLEALFESAPVSAVLCCFMDDLMASRNAPAAITGEDGGVWTDENGASWLDPQNEAVQAYITALCLELAELGAEEIILAGYAYPPGAPVDLTEGEQAEVILDFLDDLAKQLRRAGSGLSLLTEDAQWLDPAEFEAPDDPENPTDETQPEDPDPEVDPGDDLEDGETGGGEGLTLEALAKVVDRIYCAVGGGREENEEYLWALTDRAKEVFAGEAGSRFILTGTGLPAIDWGWMGEYPPADGLTPEIEEP